MNNIYDFCFFLGESYSLNDLSTNNKLKMVPNWVELFKNYFLMLIKLIELTLMICWFCLDLPIRWISIRVCELLPGLPQWQFIWTKNRQIKNKFPSYSENKKGYYVELFLWSDAGIIYGKRPFRKFMKSKYKSTVAYSQNTYRKHTYYIHKESCFHL